MRSRSDRHLLTGSVHAALLGVVVGAAGLGALTSPARVTLLGAPVVGAVATAVPLLVAWGDVRPRPSPRTLALTGCAGALAVPLVAGLSLLGLTAAVLLLAPVVLGVPWRHRSGWSTSVQVSGNRHSTVVPRHRGRS